MYLIQNAVISFLTGMGEKQFEYQSNIVSIKKCSTIEIIKRRFVISEKGEYLTVPSQLFFPLNFNAGYEKITEKVWSNFMARFKYIYCLKRELNYSLVVMIRVLRVFTTKFKTNYWKLRMCQNAHVLNTCQEETQRKFEP